MPSPPGQSRLNGRTWGNVTPEYALIGAIVLGASCVVLANVGDTVSVLFNNMLGTKPQQTTEVTAPPKGNGQAAPPYSKVKGCASPSLMGPPSTYRNTPRISPH